MSAFPLILITGCSGMVGQAVAKQLATAHTIVGLDHVAPADPASVGISIQMDLSDPASVQHALSEVRRRFGLQVDAVIHAASFYNFDDDDDPRYNSVNIEGTRHFVRSLFQHNFFVKQIIYTSSMLVHEPTRPGFPITESWPLRKSWAYPRSKIAAEDVLRTEHQGIPTVLLRIAGIYDRFCRCAPLAHQIKRIYERDITSRVFPGDITHGQAYVHLADVAEAIERCIRYRNVLTDITPLIIGEPEIMSYDELQRLIARHLHDEDWSTQQVPKPIAKTGAWMQAHLPWRDDPFIKPWMIDYADDHYELDISCARTFLGWNPKHSLKRELPNMLQSLKHNPTAWYNRNHLMSTAQAGSHH